MRTVLRITAVQVRLSHLPAFHGHHKLRHVTMVAVVRTMTVHMRMVGLPWYACPAVTIEAGAARVHQVMARMAGACASTAAALALYQIAGVAEEPASPTYVKDHRDQATNIIVMQLIASMFHNEVAK